MVLGETDINELVVIVVECGPAGETEEMLGNEVISEIVKPLPMSSDEDNTVDDIVESVPRFVVETVIGAEKELVALPTVVVYGTSLGCKDVNNDCLSIEEVGGKMELTDWLDFIVLVTAYADDVVVTTSPWLLELTIVVVGDTTLRSTKDDSLPLPPVCKLPLPSSVFILSPPTVVG